MISNEQYSIVMPGRIVSYDPVDETASVLLCAERVVHDSGRVDNISERLPIEGVPVHVVGGGGYYLTFPIKAGDTCQVSFSQVGYDHWLYEDKDVAGSFAGRPQPWLNRQFDENDGFCIVGYNTFGRKVGNRAEGYPGITTGLQLRNDKGDSYYHISDDGDTYIASGTSLVIMRKDGDISVASDTKISLDAPTIQLTGDVNVIGPMTVSETIVATGEVTGNGIPLSTHLHGQANTTVNATTQGTTLVPTTVPVAPG